MELFPSQKMEARTLKAPGNQQQKRSSCPPMSLGWFPSLVFFQREDGIPSDFGWKWWVDSITSHVKKGHNLFRSWIEGENPQPRILYFGPWIKPLVFFRHLLPVLGWSSKVADISLVSNVHVSALNRFRKLCHFCLVVLRKKSRDVSKMFPYFFFSFRFREVSGSKFKSEVDI